MRRDFVRGSQYGRWSDGDFAAWEMRDSRENPTMSVANSTVLLVMMARGFTGGLRDNPPPKDNFSASGAPEIFTGYEQMDFVDRTVEKFAATSVSRNVIGSAGAETWSTTIGSGSFSRNDIDLKRRMETQFEITSFDATAAPHYPHNDHGEMSTGLDEGFHILRTKAFLGRSGHASIFRTEAQTFYYDAARPSAQVLFPHPNDRLGGTTYGAVAISDATVTEVCYNILDSEPGNDSAADGNGAGNWALATAVTVPSLLGSSGLAKEWRFDYRNIPGSSTATIAVRFKEVSSSGDNSLSDGDGHYTTITVPANTGSLVNYRFGFPTTDGQTVDENYVANTRSKSRRSRPERQGKNCPGDPVSRSKPPPKRLGSQFPPAFTVAGMPTTL